ncbi:MAG: hypothetical protein AUK34_00350 [Ignavibacteria bacterium CG2_30_36_16]|nr:T9SS type A sorting domain-containing protein [Ignavibacteria bacterium]OIP64135.1 MAG: hypothetical protein AUK34_00350 [Ignavibacteria bacterium CG2_30_36_16]
MENIFIRILNAVVLGIFFSVLTLPQSYRTDKPPGNVVSINDSVPSKQVVNYRRTDPDNLPEESDYKKPKEEVFPLNYFRSTGVWTELNPKVPRVSYIGLHFVNKDTGWAVGGSGAIIKTTNGGVDWTIAETPVTNLLLKIHSYNGQIVLATGYDGIILRSIDGGENFELIPTGLGNDRDLWGVQMISDSVGWVCGMYSSLLKTTDAGLTWQRDSLPFSYHYWGLNFLNENFGMIACSNGNMLRTTDGGVNWQQILTGDTRDLYSVDIIDSLHAAAAGERELEIQYEGGKNIYSSDGGLTWVMNDDIPTYQDANCIEFVNRDTGYTINVNKGIYKTTNRGQNWTFVGGGGDWHVQVLNDGTGYCGGNDLNIYKKTEGTESWKKIILNDNFSDVYFFNETTGYILSWALYKTTTGGLSWTRIENAPGGNSLLFLDSLTGFIGGSQSLFKTTDGGVNWYNVNGVPGGVGKIFFTNSLTGWATSGRNIINTTDGGENWITQITLPADNFSSLHFIDSLNGWAATRYIWQTTNGGTNWIQRSDIPAFMSTDIYFINNKGFILELLKLYRSDNNGATWYTQLNSPYIIKNFGWLSNDHGFIMGGSVVYETIDSGNTWSLVSELSNIGLQKFHAPHNYLGYSTGNLGLIYKYIDTSIVPVELISFQGMVENKKVILTWQTASELNNSGFQVEKSFDKENWFNIGFVEGSGTTTEKINYIFIDNNIVTNIQYYRLKQVDHNGQYKFSDIIKIIGNSLITTFQLYPSYPNPFNSSTVISYQVPHRSFINISLYNIIGEKIIQIVNEEKSEGLHKELFQSSLLPSGVYFVRMTSSAGFNAVNKITLIK